MIGMQNTKNEGPYKLPDSDLKKATQASVAIHSVSTRVSTNAPTGACTAGGLTLDPRTCGFGRAAVVSRLATSVRQVTRDQMELGPTGADTGRSCFLLSCGSDRGRYYRVTHGTGPIPNETQFPCRTLGACLVVSD